MSIMGCYQDKRAIENELGGKWELFFEETRETSGNVGYEWTLDHNDDTPLNLNGIMIDIANNSSVTTANTGITFTVNDVSIFATTLSTGTSATKIVVKTKIENGCLDTSMIMSPTNTGGANRVCSRRGLTTLLDNITKFTFGASNITANTEIKVYVLRGV